MKLKQLIREYNFNIEPSEQEFSQYIDENKKQELIQELFAKNSGKKCSGLNLSVSYLVVEPLLKLSKNISKIKDKRNDS